MCRAHTCTHGPGYRTDCGRVMPHFVNYNSLHRVDNVYTYNLAIYSSSPSHSRMTLPHLCSTPRVHEEPNKQESMWPCSSPHFQPPPQGVVAFALRTFILHLRQRKSDRVEAHACSFPVALLTDKINRGPFSFGRRVTLIRGRVRPRFLPSTDTISER
jgi:hypothetical protein